MPSSESSDIVIIGDGIIGLACAYSLAARGARVHLLGRRRHGFASAAAAGLLAPTIEAAAGVARSFAVAARDRYRSFLDTLEEKTGHSVPLDLDGILRVPVDDAEEISLRAEAGASTAWLSSTEVAKLEPSVAAPRGALLHTHDGMVDNIRLLAALEAGVSLGGITRVGTDAVRLDFSGSAPVIETGAGTRVKCEQVVLAAGAWSRLIDGLPRPLPVAPLRGQMLALSGTPVRRPVYGVGGYIAPRRRDGYTIAGSTSEAVGFSVATTDEALTAFRHVASSLVPEMNRADEVRSWAGLRPMTMDGLPILGRDPDVSSLIYACGHSRNGILMAPITADVVTALVTGQLVPHSITQYSISRFVPGEIASS